MKAVIALTVATGALGNECSAGYKHKSDLTMRKCASIYHDALSCNSECCEKDESTCGGLSAPTCSWKNFADVDSDAWKRISATEANKDKNCCAPKATCGSGAYSCPAGYDKKSPDTLCAGGPETCKENAICCVPNPKKCVSLTKATAGTPPADKYFPDATAKNVIADAWQNIEFGTDKTKCYKPKGTCSSGFACPVGTMKVATTTNTLKAWADITKTPKSTDKCASDPATCVKQCCIPDVQTCGGLGMKDTANYATDYATALACPGDTYVPVIGTSPKFEDRDLDFAEWAKRPIAKGASAAAKQKECCLPRPKCGSHACPAGKKMKPGMALQTCARKETCTADCCMDDDQKCGGLTGITCPYGFFYEPDGWDHRGVKATVQGIMDAWRNKPGNVTNKNVNCCTERAACSRAAIFTSTPVAPALKFSALNGDVTKKIKKEEKRAGTAVWVGAGAFVGFVILAFARTANSRKASHEDDGDSQVLLDRGFE